MRLALFDLDHTLIGFDSGMAWTAWLASAGVLDADAPQRYLAQCRELVAGRLDIAALHTATVTPLAALDRATLHHLLRRFEAAVAPRLAADRLALVERHRAAGDHCVLVTATTRFIAEVFGRLFGIDTVLATESTWHDDHLTGDTDGPPCWGAAKAARVDAWLATQGLHLASLPESHFYSDSASDLPLLLAVRHPVAVRPDARLRAEALARGWAVLE